MLERVTIAAPCSADWDSMPGTDQVRHCGQCNKNVYNLSAMNRRQAEALLRETEGRLCARLYRRADGTILTENCPAGLRTIGRRVSRVAGAAMSAVAALSSATAAQFPMFPLPAAVTGVVQDQSGAVIANAKVDLISDASGKTFTLRADGSGRFQAGLLPPGAYTIRIESSGFQLLTRHDSLSAGMQLKLAATLQIGGAMLGVVVVD
jgi:hypothetical protein